MSLNQIIKPNDSSIACNAPSWKNLQVKNISACTINGHTFNPMPSPGAIHQVLNIDALGDPQWEFINKDNFNIGGTAGEVLHISNLNELEFTDTVQLENLQINTELVSLVSNNLDNVNFVNNITLNNVASGNNQFLGTNSLGNLEWQSLTTGQGIQSAIYYCTNAQNFNSGASQYATFIDPPLYDTCNIVYNVDQFELPFNQGQVFKVEFKAAVQASASSIKLSIEWNSVDISEFLLEVGENCGSTSTIVTPSIGANIIKIKSVRVGVDATAKSNPSAISSQIIFHRIA